MKTWINFISITITAVILTSCSASYDAAAYEDDAFYNPYREKNLTKKQKRLGQKLDETNSNASSYDGDVTTSENNNPAPETTTTSSPVARTYTDDNGDYYAIEEGDLGEDYYDYSYTRRIRRFHNQDVYVRGYYDNYYIDDYYYDGSRYGSCVYIVNYYPTYGFGGYWGWGFG